MLYTGMLGSRGAGGADVVVVVGSGGGSGRSCGGGSSAGKACERERGRKMYRKSGGGLGVAGR